VAVVLVVELVLNRQAATAVQAVALLVIMVQALTLVELQLQDKVIMVEVLAILTRVWLAAAVLVLLVGMFLAQILRLAVLDHLLIHLGEVQLPQVKTLVELIIMQEVAAAAATIIQ
jgi:hypothetical protein